MVNHRKLRIFVSSALKELKNERVITREVISKKFKFIPVMFEDLGANTDAARVVYRREVASSDILVLILGRVYSSPTEEEFHLADEMGKDILVYVKKDESNSREPKQRKLINEIKDPKKGRIYYEFDTVLDLRDRLQENISTTISKRAKRLKKQVQLDFKTLLSICQEQVKTEIQYLKGSVKEKSKKYIPDLYVKRVEIEREFKEFLEQRDKNACVVVGEAGIGKTNLLCHMSEELSLNRPVLFLNSLYVTEPLEKHILSIFQDEKGAGSSFRELIDRINKVLSQKNLDLIIFLDAINESPNPSKMKNDLAKFTQSNVESRVRLYISCRDIDWEFYLRNNEKFLNCLYSKRGRVFRRNDIRFDEFSETEFKEAWKRYKGMYILKGTPGKKLKKICKHPLMLRFLAEGFEGRKIPKDVRRIEIFDRYWFRKLEHTGKQDRATEYMFVIAEHLKKKRASDLLKTEIVGLLDDTTETLQTVLSKILSENLITYLNWHGDRVVGFAYEAFFEYVMARWIMYGELYRWSCKDKKGILSDFKDFIEEAKRYRTMKGTMQYLVMMMEGKKRDIHINMLKELSKTKDPSWQSFVIAVTHKLRTPRKLVHIIGELSRQGDFRAFALRALGNIGGNVAAQYLTEALEDDDDDIWKESITSLTKIGDRKALSILANALLNSSNVALKYEVVRTLRRRKSIILTSVLIDKLTQADIFAKSYLVEILGELQDPKAIPYLMDIIKDENEVTLTPAIEALGKVVTDTRSLEKGEIEKVVDFLIDLLTYRDDFVKVAAARSLGAIGFKKAIKPLLHLLSEKKIEVKKGAMEALSMIGGVNIMDELAGLLTQYDESIWKKAAASLGLIGSPKAILALVGAAKHKQRRGRQYIYKVIEAVGVERSLPVLLSAITQDHPMACFIIEAIGYLKSDFALEPLLAFLQKNPKQCDKEVIMAIGRIGGELGRKKMHEFLTDRDRDHQSYAIVVLGEMKDSRAVKPLVGFLGDRDEGLRVQSVEALGKIADPGTLGPLIKASESAKKNDRMRRAIATALGSIGGEKAVDHLIFLLKDENNFVRMSAADSLGLISSGRAVAPLLKALGSEKEDNVKLSIISALGTIGNVTATSPLIHVLRKEKTDVEITRRVIVALGKIRSPKANKVLIGLLEGRNWQEALKQFYSRQRWDYRLEIIEALAVIGGAEAANALMRFLKKPVKIYSGKASSQLNSYERRIRTAASKGLMTIFGRETEK